MSKNFNIPSPRFRSEKFIDALVKITCEEKIDFLIPSFEEIFCLSQGINRFPKTCKIFSPSYKILDTLHNKWLFNKKIEKLGFLSPKSILIHSQEELNTLTLKPPYILKPSYSRAAQQIFKITSETVPTLDINPYNPLVAQEWLHGKKYCTYSISHKGKLTTHTTYPVGYSLDGNACLNFTAIEHPKIQKWVEKFVSIEKFTGQIAFDFIEVKGKGLYAIECNPRGTSGIHLYQKKDNLPAAFLNPNQKLIAPQTGFSKQIMWGMILYGWRASDSPKKFFQYLKQLFNTRDIIFSFSDMHPFFYQPILLAIYAYKSLKLKTCLPTMFTFDIDWNGQTLANLDQISCDQ